MKLSALLSCGIVCIALVGCSDANGVKNVSQADAEKLNAAHNQSNLPADQPLTADTRYAAGQMAEVQHDTDNAIHQYNEALKADPKHLPSLYRLGVLLTEMKNYPDALNIWHKYADATKNSANAFANLGFCYEMAGQPNQAEESYQKGIEKDPKNVQCRTNYGLMLARHDRIGEAVRMWQPALSDAEIHYDLASVYELDNRRQEARAEYQKALDADPKFSDAKQRLSALE